MGNSKELKYLLCFVSKLMGFTDPMEFLFNQDQQFNFESIILVLLLFIIMGEQLRVR